MIDSHKFDDKTLSVYANNLMFGIFKNIIIVKQALEKDNFPIGFNERSINVIQNELLYYFLNICDRALYDIYDYEIRTKIMNSLVDLIAKALDQVKNDIMEEQIMDLDDTKKLRLYLKVLRTTYDSQEFVSTYNKRQKEYESYLSLFGDTKPDMDNAIEKKYVELVHSQIWGFGIEKNPIPEVKLILWSIPIETHFYKQLSKIIPRIEHQVGLFDVGD